MDRESVSTLMSMSGRWFVSGINPWIIVSTHFLPKKHLEVRAEPGPEMATSAGVDDWVISPKQNSGCQGRFHHVVLYLKLKGVVGFSFLHSTLDLYL